MPRQRRAKPSSAATRASTREGRGHGRVGVRGFRARTRVVRGRPRRHRGDASSGAVSRRRPPGRRRHPGPRRDRARAGRTRGRVLPRALPGRRGLRRRRTGRLPHAFAAAATGAGSSQVVYLGGLGDDRGRPLRAPAQPARGRVDPPGRRADDRPAGRHRDRRRQHQLGDPAPARRAAPGDGHAAMGADEHPADRPRRRAVRPRGCARATGGDRRGLRDRRT